MFLSCSYCQRFFKREDNRISLEKQLWQKKQQRTSLSYQKAPWVPKWNGIWRSVSAQDTLQCFDLVHPLVVARPSPCFIKSLLLGHLEGLFVNPPLMIHYRYGLGQDGFQDLTDASWNWQFQEGVPASTHLKSWLPKNRTGILVLDDLIAEGGKDKELLDLFTWAGLFKARLS